MDEMARRQWIRRNGKGIFARKEAENAMPKMLADNDENPQRICQNRTVRLPQEKSAQKAQDSGSKVEERV